MKKQTGPSLRNKVIYSVFVRNHTKEGTFRALEGDLDRLQALGTDIIWLMPIHPIGAVNRKGALGSPYAIRDYRTVNPEYGTMEDFTHLVEEIHRRGMRCIIDVVYNHTSPDSVLAQEHPEFFLQDAQGRPTRKVPDWYDIVDLDFTAPALWDYLIETLCRWAELVDGFRCDVASAVPVDFWRAARSAVAEVRPNCIWLAESVFPDFTMEMRKRGIVSATDTELYDVFDMTYDYDVWRYFEGYLRGENTLREYVNVINFQEEQYPTDYVKLRFLENHDQERIGARIGEEHALRSWLAFTYFEKGAVLLYSGSEFAPSHQVTLFDADDCYSDKRWDLQVYLTRLKAIKRELPADGCFRLCAAADHVITGSYEGPDGTAYGVFPLKGSGQAVPVHLPDGTYRNLIDDNTVSVVHGCLTCGHEAIIIRERGTR